MGTGCFKERSRCYDTALDWPCCLLVCCQWRRRPRTRPNSSCRSRGRQVDIYLVRTKDGQSKTFYCTVLYMQSHLCLSAIVFLFKNNNKKSGLSTMPRHFPPTATTINRFEQKKMWRTFFAPEKDVTSGKPNCSTDNTDEK